MRELWSVVGNRQKLDGGAMFGNAPKALWSRWMTADDSNRIDLCCRALLIREMHNGRPRHVLLETGIGAFFEPKFRERYGVVEPQHVLLESLAAIGVAPADIDVIVLSHLHFDHAGGLLLPWAEGQAPTLAFPNADYVVGEEAWQRALQPHPRDRASFIPGLTDLMAATGRLERVAGEASAVLGAGYRFHVSNGHTPGMLLTEVELPDGPLVFAADLVPGLPWVHLPVTMGYDRYPEVLIEEKERLFADLLARQGRLFFTHDPATAMGRLHRDEQGRFGCVDVHADLVALAH